MTPVELARLSMLLDEALDMDGPQRDTWLGQLTGDDTPLAPTLRDLLARQASQETADLLDRPPAFTVTDAPLEPTQSRPGDIVGAYRLERLLGRGGMGEVWLAERSDGTLKRKVALKLPHVTWAPGLAERFAREREILSGLEHPNIARLYDAGVDILGRPYMALEYVEGQPITEYCAAAHTDLRGRVQLVMQVARAVQYAHANLVIHRDLKPSNVLVRADGQAMLLDFGIAKLVEEEHAEAAETELTRMGGRALTLGYAAPEQVSGAPVSTATDVYALGALLYELLAGTRPFVGSRRAMEEAVLTQEPVRPKGAPVDLATIVLKALKKLPAERYATADAFGEDLGRWLAGETVRAQPDSAWYRTRKFVGRNRTAAAAAVVVLVTVGSASAVSLWQAAVAREQMRIAEKEAKTAEAVQNFLEGIFRISAGDQADPVKARQRTAKELLDEGAARVDKELEDAPQAKMRVLATLASIYDDLGETERTADLQLKRLELIERTVPVASAQRAEAHADLAMTLAVIGRDAEASTHLAKAASIASSLPESDRETRSTVDMAEVQYFAARNDPRGLEPSRRLVARLRVKPPSLSLVDTLRAQGELEISAGTPAQAVKTLREAADVAKGLKGGGEYAQIFVLLSLAAAEAANGESEAVLDDARAALQMAVSNTGESSSITILTMGVLGRLLTEQGRPREAMVPLLEARRRLEAVPAMAESGDIVARLSTEEARALRRLGRLDQALARFDIALSASKAANSSMREFWSAHGRAQVLTDQGRFADAQRTVAEMRAIRDRLDLRAYSQFLALTQAEASLALASGDPANAGQIWQRFTDDARTAIRRKDAAVLALEAEVTMAVAGPAKAVETAQRALVTLQTSPSQPNAVFEKSRLLLVLARGKRMLGEGAETLTLLLEALHEAESVYDPTVSVVVSDLHLAVAEAMLASGRVDMARKHLDAAKAIQSKHARLGPQYTEPVRDLAKRLAPG
ncbi:MAG: serine/threonine-protein kinase [Betaproteobacteria bacterium]